MKVVASNCGCCAIKHIRDFEESPNFYGHCHGYGHNEDQSSTAPEPYYNWSHYSAASGEEAGEVFKALVADIKRRRPAGMITANLAAYVLEEDGYCCEDCNGMSESEWDSLRCGEGPHYNSEQVDAWRPLFEAEGFQEQTFLNSNSGNRIHHFTLVYDEGGWDPD